MMTRRGLLAGGLAAVAFRDDALNVVERLATTFKGVPDDEDFWTGIQQAFALDRNVVNFNNGGCSPSPRVVQDALRRQLEFSNQAPSHTMWRNLEPEIESVRTRLARLYGCDPEEMAITRNASESLETVLFGLDLKAGDEILTTNLDYPRMIQSIQQRERREGLRMVQVAVPGLPKSHNELLKPIESGITDRTKLILVSQVSFLNGQIFPIKEIVALGHRHNIPVLVDGAHGFVQYACDYGELDCDFYGASLHKWLMAPVGTGLLYMKKETIGNVWSLMASRADQSKDIRKFEEIGTHPAANHNAIGEAITFHEMLGIKRKEARLRYLRARWTDRLKDHPKIRFNTNLAKDHSCALTTVRIEGITPGDLAGWLLGKHAIFVTTIVTDAVNGIRVSPNVYSTVDEVDRFAEAILMAAAKGIR